MNSQAALYDKLSAVRRRWIIRDAVLSMSRTVLAIAPVCLVLGWLDYRLDFSPAVRFIELAGFIMLIGWAFRRFVAPMIAQRRDAYAAALKLESIYDRFKGRLVSYVQFRGEPGRKASGTSTTLIAAMCERVENEAIDIRPADAIDMTSVRRPATAAGLTILLISLIVLHRPGLAPLWIKRTLMPPVDISWPQRTHIIGINDQYHVRRGSSLKITGRITGDIPHTGRLTWQYIEAEKNGNLSANHIAFDITPAGRFEADVGPLSDSAILTIQAGDTWIKDIPVQVITPPELSSIEGLYTYPAFTRWEPKNVKGGDIRAIVGTHVRLTIHADRPVARMELIASNHKGKQVRPVALLSSTRGSASIIIGAPGEYQVHLFDADGHATDSPATFIIDPVDNERPTAKIVRPGIEHLVTPTTRLKLAFEAADDFAVTSTSIRWQKRKLGTEELIFPGSISLPIDPPRPLIREQYLWDLATADLQPGDEIAYKIEVGDEGEHLTERKVGESAVHVLKVVDPLVLQHSLEARQQAALNDLNRLKQRQAYLLDEALVAAQSPPGKDTPTAPADEHLLTIDQDRQILIRHISERLVERLTAIADVLNESFPNHRSRIEELQQLTENLSRLAGGQFGGTSSPKVAGILDSTGTPQDSMTSAEAEASQPWYWNLPPQARQVISQSLAEPFPPKYAEMIKQFYERLSRKKENGH